MKNYPKKNDGIFFETEKRYGLHALKVIFEKAELRTALLYNERVLEHLNTA